MSETDAQQSAVAKLTDIYRTARNEHAEASFGERAVVITALGGLAFEWGTGNEAMLGYVGSRVHEMTHNPIVTGMITGSASFVEQGVIGGLMAASIQNFPEITTKIREAVSGRDIVNEDTRLRRFASVMLLGSGVELAVENSKRSHSKAENIRRALGSSAIIASANTMLIGGMSGLMKLGETHGFESATESIVDVTSNPLTYVGAITTVIGYNKIKRTFQKRSKIKKLNKQIPLENPAGE